MSVARQTPAARPASPPLPVSSWLKYPSAARPLRRRPIGSPAVMSLSLLPGALWVLAPAVTARLAK